MSRDYVLQSFRAPPELQIDYAGALNEQQHAAVTAPPGPSLVIAGAGSGKTRTLIYRVAYLLEQGIPADRILLLTFTNKAAREMMTRAADLLGQELGDLWGGTFHAIGNRVLRKNADRLGFRNDFSILDREDARHVVTTCLAESGIDVKAMLFPKPDVLADIFSLAANTGASVKELVETRYDRQAHHAGQIEDLRRRYAARKLAGNSMDFDDLLTLWLRLLREDEDARELYQRRFQFILVDEYQDTNKVQGDLIDLLAARSRNVMAVGDDAQSIYAWRGADYQNILRFPERYPEAKVYKIETNYRSTPEILEVANATIRANVHQFAKQLAPARKCGQKPVVVACTDSSEQAAFVAQRALELREEGADLNKMAVLYRSHFHALELQLELTARHIPFSITSGIRFFEQAHIKDVTAYLKLVFNPRDEFSFKRLAQLLPGVGGKAADRLWKAFEAQNTTPQKSDAAPAPSVAQPLIATALAGCAGVAPKKSAVGWAQFTTTLSQLEADDMRNDPSKMIGLVLEAGYEDVLQENYANHVSRRDDLNELAIFAAKFGGLEDFLSQLALLTNLEAEDGQPAAADDERLRLSTIHQAKGLEFDVVFIIMLCDGLFPSSRSLESPGGEEEERRLMYVAATRARNELYLSYPLLRATPGGGDLRQLPSRFLKEIPVDLVEVWNLKPFHAQG